VSGSLPTLYHGGRFEAPALEDSPLPEASFRVENNRQTVSSSRTQALMTCLGPSRRVLLRARLFSSFHVSIGLGDASDPHLMMFKIQISGWHTLSGQ
jgi:hypothetical protein